MHRHELVGWAIDLDVSGSISPFETPELGAWLAEPESFDILCAYRLDRLARRVVPLNPQGWLAVDQAANDLGKAINQE